MGGLFHFEIIDRWPPEVPYQTCASDRQISALGGKADIPPTRCYVRL
jgi:hypothetical protein